MCGRLTEILEKVGRMALKDPALLCAYKFPEHFLELLQINPGYDRLAPILRLDGHFVNGAFRLVETNADGSAGMNDSNAIESAVIRTPVYREFLRRQTFDSLDMVGPLVRMLLKYRGAHLGPIGILDLPGVSTASEFAAVRARISAFGAGALILTPRDLSYRRDLQANGRSLKFVYRRLVTSDALRHWDEITPLLQAYRLGRVRMVGSFRSELLHNKAILALLRHPHVRKKLTVAERAMIDRHVPRAAILTTASAEAAVSAKNSWVVKPLDAYGSRGVVVGRVTNRAGWVRALRKALREGRYLLQEYVAAPKESVLRVEKGRVGLSREMTSIGFFVYDGKMAGPYVRSGPTHPLSISYGAVTRPAFVVRPVGSSGGWVQPRPQLPKAGPRPGRV